jgi:hypothetical protein
MMRLEIRDACFVNGEPVEIGSKITVDQPTAKTLLSMGRAVMAADESQPEAPAEAPRPTPRARARTTAQPLTPKQED